jgi:hypothetical protein
LGLAWQRSSPGLTIMLTPKSQRAIGAITIAKDVDAEVKSSNSVRLSICKMVDLKSFWKERTIRRFMHSKLRIVVHHLKDHRLFDSSINFRSLRT